MKIIFTKSSAPMSKAIQWIFKQPCSHVAIVLFDKIVIHSNLYGVHLEWFASFQKKCTVVFELDYALDRKAQVKIMTDMLNAYDGNGYDFGALIYFGLAGIAHRLFGVKMPVKNIWKNSHKFLCTEWVEVASAYLPPELSVSTNSDMAITTPHDLYLMLKRAKK